MGKQKMNGNGKTFVKITNRQVWDELCKLKEDNDKQHQQILLSIQGYKSQISRFYWALGGIGVLALSTLGWLFNHINN